MSSLVFEKKLPCGTFRTYNERPNFEITKVKQIHSAHIVSLDQASKSEIEADGIIADNSDTPLCIVTADCMPIIICGDTGVVFLHAGWRGLAANILASPEVKKVNPSYAFFGPHICQKNYEVSDDFLDHFSKGQVAFKKMGDSLLFSLEAEAKRQIEDLYGPITVESSNICTYEDNKFHSYRLNQTKERNWMKNYRRD